MRAYTLKQHRECMQRKIKELNILRQQQGDATNLQDSIRLNKECDVKRNEIENYKNNIIDYLLNPIEPK